MLLLDEPLSALDAKVRRQLREEIRRIQIMVGTTTLFVTHDQEEALAIGDRVGVMSAGRLEQIAAAGRALRPPADARSSPSSWGSPTGSPGTAHGGVVEVLGTRVPLLEGSARSGPVHGARPARESVRLAPGGRRGGSRRRGQLPRLALPRPGRSCPTATLVVAQMAAADATSSAPGTAVSVGVRRRSDLRRRRTAPPPTRERIAGWIGR